MPVPKLLLHTNDFYSTQILANDILCVVAQNECQHYVYVAVCKYILHVRIGVTFLMHNCK